jgi:hypothetical protein
LVPSPRPEAKSGEGNHIFGLGRGNLWTVNQSAGTLANRGVRRRTVSARVVVGKLFLIDHMIRLGGVRTSSGWRVLFRVDPEVGRFVFCAGVDLVQVIFRRRFLS